MSNFTKLFSLVLGPVFLVSGAFAAVPADNCKPSTLKGGEYTSQISGKSFYVDVCQKQDGSWMGWTEINGTVYKYPFETKFVKTNDEADARGVLTDAMRKYDPDLIRKDENQRLSHKRYEDSCKGFRCISN